MMSLSNENLQDVNLYISKIEEFYIKNKYTTEIQVDTLVLIYKFSNNGRAFNLLFKTHKKLLDKISYEFFNKYRNYLYEDDIGDIQSIVYGEFVRRICFYKFPPVAPFSKYIKLYLRKWCNSYVKLIVGKNNRYILYCDADLGGMNIEIDEFTYKDGFWKCRIDN